MPKEKNDYFYDLMVAKIELEYEFYERWMIYKWLKKIKDNAPSWCLPVLIIEKERKKPLVIVDMRDYERIPYLKNERRRDYEYDFIDRALNLSFEFGHLNIWALEEFVKAWAYTSERLLTPQILREVEDIDL